MKISKYKMKQISSIKLFRKSLQKTFLFLNLLASTWVCVTGVTFREQFLAGKQSPEMELKVTWKLNERKSLKPSSTCWEPFRLLAALLWAVYSSEVRFAVPSLRGA